MEKFIIIDRIDRQILHGPQHLMMITIKELKVFPDFFYDLFSHLDPETFQELFDSTVESLGDEYKTVEVDNEHLHVCERY